MVLGAAGGGYGGWSDAAVIVVQGPGFTYTTGEYNLLGSLSLSAP